MVWGDRMLQRVFEKRISAYYACFAITTLALGPSEAMAQESTTIELAGNHVEAAQLFFTQERYQDAAREFEAAYRIVPYAEFLYNMGVCYERAEAVEPEATQRRHMQTRREGCIVQVVASPALPPSVICHSTL